MMSSKKGLEGGSGNYKPVSLTAVPGMVMEHLGCIHMAHTQQTRDHAHTAQV